MISSAAAETSQNMNCFSTKHLIFVFILFLSSIICFIQGVIHVPVRRRHIGITRPKTYRSTSSFGFETLSDRPIVETSLRNLDNVQFVGSINVGTPPQSIDVIFDSGSFHTWLPDSGDKCIVSDGGRSEECKGGFVMSRSATATTLSPREEFKETYISVGFSLWTFAVVLKDNRPQFLGTSSPISSSLER